MNRIRHLFSHLVLSVSLLLLISLMSSCGRGGNAGDVPGSSPQKKGVNLPVSPEGKMQNRFINPKDGAELVLIPRGVFYMGAVPGDNLADVKEKPLHKVFLEDYYIYRYEVTRGQFKKFTNATGYRTTAEKSGKPYTWRTYLKEDRMNLPVTFLSWTDADAYCRWAGGHLPTEAQWEKAARGTDRRVYPWGNRMNVKFFNNDIPDGSTPPTHKESEDREDDIPIDFGKPGGSFPEGASPYGAMDMIGSVFEFCTDWYGLYEENYKNFAVYEPFGPVIGQNKIMKGGGNCDDLRNFRISNRDMAKPGEDYCDYGFRMSMSREEYQTAGEAGKDTLENKDEAAAKNRRNIILNLKDNSLVLLFSPVSSPKNRNPARIREGIYLNPVSESQYGKFLKETGHKSISEAVKSEQGNVDAPVLLKNRADAEKYCRWAGGKLPDEAALEMFEKLVNEPDGSSTGKVKNKHSSERPGEWTVTGENSSGEVDTSGKSFRVFFPQDKIN